MKNDFCYFVTELKDFPCPNTTQLKRFTLVICFLYLLTSVSCKQEKNLPVKNNTKQQTTVTHALGFSINNSGDFPIVTVTNPWPNAKQSFTYAFIPKDDLEANPTPKGNYDAIIRTPVENLVVTSTTHIPALEALGGLDRLRGFPDTKYISSMPARQLISEGKIKELGNNETFHTEMVLEMQPDAIVGFAMDSNNAAYELLQKSGIPVLFNGDWTEQTPLGKAEWIKFFGVLLNKQKKAEQLFNEIEVDYKKIKELAVQASKKPTVLSGALYKDIWYLPAGESWAAQFITDANAHYLWFDTKGTGSLSLSLESVLEKGQAAEFWISPSQFKGYEEMSTSNTHYKEFIAFKNQNIHTFSNTTGPTGGLLFYELGPQRPDMILKDLVRIFHPELLPEYTPFFFKPLK
jgi:iron complex transport system substrate-binding protein